MQQAFDHYRYELEKELGTLLQWWMNFMPDEKNGGFFGQVNDFNESNPESPKGLVLNARILWTFAAAHCYSPDPGYLAMAEQAYDYIRTHFSDQKNGGYYWSVNSQGTPLEDKKQIYGQAFCLYGLTELYRITRREAVLAEAISLYQLIETHALDKLKGGYIEAFTRDWKPIADLRLSEQDANEKKTMNTHLHVLEAYANLYSVWKDESLGNAVKSLLDLFADKIISTRTNHLDLFFDEDWQVKSSVYSFGHDIEAAWLLQEAAEILDCPVCKNKFRKIALVLADAVSEGIDTDGGLWYEYDPVTNHWIKEKHWWPQAEAMIGFFNAWEISKQTDYFLQSLQSWNFVKKYLKDEKYGEWSWGVDSVHVPLPGQDKAGFWKCPYHNSRACLELLKRMKRTLPEQKQY